MNRVILFFRLPLPLSRGSHLFSTAFTEDARSLMFLISTGPYRKPPQGLVVSRKYLNSMAQVSPVCRSFRSYSWRQESSNRRTGSVFLCLRTGGLMDLHPAYIPLHYVLRLPLS